MLIKGLIILSLLMPHFVYANWQFVRQDSNNTLYYFKKDNYKKLFGGSELVELIDLKVPEKITTNRRGTDEIPQKESYLSIRSTFDIDCKNMEQRISSVQYYSGQMGKGLLVTETSSKSEWFRLDSSSEMIVCKNR